MITNLPSGYIQEYSELRAEIRHYLERRQSTRRFAYFLSLAVLGIGTGNGDIIKSSDIPAPVFIVPPLLLLSLWADELRRLRTIQRLGTYLRVVIEPYVQGFHYETLGLESKRKPTLLSRVFPNADFPILLMSLTILCAWKFSIWKPTEGLVVASLISTVFLIAMLLILYQSVSIARSGEREEESLWMEAIVSNARKKKANLWDIDTGISKKSGESRKQISEEAISPASERIRKAFPAILPLHKSVIRLLRILSFRGSHNV